MFERKMIMNISPAKSYQFLTHKLVQIVLAFALLIAASKISIPIGPVPLTMQTCAVGLVGALLGARLGSMTVCIYLVGGFIGLPIFATPLAGPAAFVGPTAGYLVAFPIGAWIAGCCADRGWNRSILLTLCAQILTNYFIVVAGAFWLGCVVGMVKAFWVGFAPFIIGAALKSVIACAVIALLNLQKKGCR